MSTGIEVLGTEGEEKECEGYVSAIGAGTCPGSL